MWIVLCPHENMYVYSICALGRSMRKKYCFYNNGYNNGYN
jgi:hypothetical protein